MTVRACRLVFAVVTLGFIWAAAPALAQLPLPPGATPSPATPNQPTSEAARKLKGAAPPPFPTALDKLPLSQLTLPKGFKIEVYAGGIPNARSLRLGDKGTVFVGKLLRDKVYAIVDHGGRREVKVIASGLDRPNSPKGGKSRSWRKSRTISTIRRSRSSSTAIFRTTSRTAGNS